MVELLVLAGLFLVLFVLSLIADRVWYAETLAKWTFGFSALSLTFLIMILAGELIVSPDLSPLDISFIDSFKWLASQFGGWSLFLAFIYLTSALGIFVAFLLSWLIDSVDPGEYGLIALGDFVIGLVFLIGFFPFFKGVSLILGVVATIIGILVGFRKLVSINSK